ncbi:MAG: hypothetical protein CME70_15240 [Halobacteriovorax sp.]|nr:hypothetical protein [Halobacteriovorax sp.]|tara:strand:- start:81682 stop:82359 length:678 start_codon:yes stop_codon:yes gene_type:complete
MRSKLGEYYSFAVITMTLVFAGSVFAIDKTHDFQVDLDQEQCLFEILHSPITKLRYPNILSDSIDGKSFAMLKEMDSFCACSVQKRKDELTQKKTDKMSWRFRDKKEGLGKEDQCALAKFSDETMDLYYHVVVSNRFRRDLEETINNRMAQGMRIIASDLSVQGQTTCMESKILKRCTRIKSLRSTYQCIEETTNDPRLMDKISLECPNLIEKTNYKIAGDDLRI